MVARTQPARLTNQAIADYAERIGRHHGIYSSGRADLDMLLKKIGGSVDYAETEESLHVRSRGDFTIFLPYFTSKARDRFTIAHELGHYFLHYRLAKVEGNKRFGRGDRNRAETEANVFASALLMPAEDFTQLWHEVDGDEWQVARRLDVSPAAASVRAEVLGLT